MSKRKPLPEEKPVYGVNHGADPATSLLRVKKADGTMTDTVFAGHDPDEVDDQAKRAMKKALDDTTDLLEVTVVLAAYWKAQTNLTVH